MVVVTSIEKGQITDQLLHPYLKEAILICSIFQLFNYL